MFSSYSSTSSMSSLEVAKTSLLLCCFVTQLSTLRTQFKHYFFDKKAYLRRGSTIHQFRTCRNPSQVFSVGACFNNVVLTAVNTGQILEVVFYKTYISSKQSKKTKCKITKHTKHANFVLLHISRRSFRHAKANCFQSSYNHFRVNLVGRLIRQMDSILKLDEMNTVSNYFLNSIVMSTNFDAPR